MFGEKRKPHQQTEQIRQDHPLVLEVQRETFEARTGLEAREDEFVEGHHRQAGQRDIQSLVMEERNADERHGE